MTEASSDEYVNREQRAGGQAALRADRPPAQEAQFSFFGPLSTNSASDSTLIDVLHAALNAGSDTRRWTANGGGAWCVVTRSHTRPRAQGWKLHVSATPESAEDVLARALPALLESECTFKFARTPDHVALLNNRHTPRGHSGKFITIYPDSDDDAVDLAGALHEATSGLPGPRILSDRPYRPGSVVHYRYGAFIEQRRFSRDGFYSWVIQDPDGNPVEDRRDGRYSPPAWAVCPFEAPKNNSQRSQRRADGAVLIGGRFLASEAIRHTNRGGVYRTTDIHSGSGVIIKEARPHVGADRSGNDERDRLRTEARILERISEHGIAPRMLTLFEQSGHVFLAEELVPGVSLRQWIPDQIRASAWSRGVPQSRSMAERVCALLDAAHRADLIVRDFNPNNIMVLPDGQLRLIDVELAVMQDEQQPPPLHVGTPGFSAPEQLDGAAPDPKADHYSLGAVFCLLFLGTAPNLIPDTPHNRSADQALNEWLAARWEGTGQPHQVRQLILDLMHPDPELRPTPAQALRVLTATEDKPPGDTPGAGVEPESDQQRWQHAVDGVIGHLLTAMTPDQERLWPVSCAQGTPDPCSVQHGAAGVLGVLTSGLRVLGGRSLGDAVATTADWIVRHLRTAEGRPPGLYFGEAGIAWSLYEAGEQLDSDEMRTEALKLAADLPVPSLNSDITHGTAGIGVALLHLWGRTNDNELLRKATRCAEELLTTAIDGDEGLSWPTPAEHHSMLAGRRYHGYAHGTAGVGYFLLAAALATGRADLMALAVRTGDTMLSHAIVQDNIAQWGTGSGDGPTAPYWCHGASGIGTFLIRLHRATGHQRFRTHAEMAARAVVESSARAPLAQCHGLAGNGDFLLDVWEATADPAYGALAQDLAKIVHSTRTHQHGRVVFPDERGELTCAWGDGMPGVLGFLLRLRHRTPRMWMVDELLTRGAAA